MLKVNLCQKKENKFVGFFIFFWVVISLVLFYPDDNDAFVIKLEKGDSLILEEKIQTAPKNLQVIMVLLLGLMAFQK